MVGGRAVGGGIRQAPTAHTTAHSCFDDDGLIITALALGCMQVPSYEAALQAASRYRAMVKWHHAVWDVERWEGMLRCMVLCGEGKFTGKRVSPSGLRAGEEVGTGGRSSFQ